MDKNEKLILQELAKKYMELANNPVNLERKQRGMDINDLTPRRPMVWLHELPWHELNIDGKMDMLCTHPSAKRMEWFFRTNLFRWEYFQADMVLTDYFPIQKNYTSTGNGLEFEEDILSNDEKNHIVSHHYKDQLDTIEKVKALKEPIIKANPEEDKKQKEMAEVVLRDIMPVNLTGTYIYYAPWDIIPMYRGVTPVLMDLIDDPDLMHETIKTFTNHGFSVMKQMEKEGLLGNDIEDVHCTPPYTKSLKPGRSLKNIWFRCMAQIFTEVSPSMWKEFELDYLMPLAEACGLTYYGCCEALEHKIPLLKTIPNLRKIGVSTQANPEKCAEQIGKNYVYAHKPNPAHVTGAFNEETVKKEITEIIELCKKYNCPYEFVLKDVSTVTYKTENLIKWNKVVQDTINKFY